MAEPSKAVFLSYASQDAAAAARIGAALRAAGIEVWFDQTELRGGDAWDQRIRGQLRDCALFIPIISEHTQARAEGYFRLEWDLADQRTHMVSRNKAFIVPVCVDGTSDKEADVPESFFKVQWTRLPAGDVPTAFSDRIAALLGNTAPDGRPATPAPIRSTMPAVAKPRSHRRIAVAVAATVLWGAVGALIVALIGWQAWRGMTSQRATGTSQAATLAVPEKSIAVLPFVDMSEKHDQEYFSDGLTEELLDMLSQVPDLRVPART